MYFISTNHKDWGDKVFTVFVTKNSYSNEEDATYLATTYTINHRYILTWRSFLKRG